MAAPGPLPGGSLSKLDITTTTVVKAAPGLLASISVTTAGSAAGAVYDAASGSGTAAELIGTIDNAVTAAPLVFNWPCQTGILVVPPTGGTVAIAYS